MHAIDFEKDAFVEQNTYINKLLFNLLLLSIGCLL